MACFWAFEMLWRNELFTIRQIYIFAIKRKRLLSETRACISAAGCNVIWPPLKPRKHAQNARKNRRHITLHSSSSKRRWLGQWLVSLCNAWSISEFASKYYYKGAWRDQLILSPTLLSQPTLTDRPYAEVLTPSPLCLPLFLSSLSFFWNSSCYFSRKLLHHCDARDGRIVIE